MPILIAAARTHPSADIREEAVEHLAEAVGERAVAVLEELATDDRSFAVRAEALEEESWRAGALTLTLSHNGRGDRTPAPCWERRRPAGSPLRSAGGTGLDLTNDLGALAAGIVGLLFLAVFAELIGVGATRIVSLAGFQDYREGPGIRGDDSVA